MIHHQGDGYLPAHPLFDAAPQFDGHQRIHAEVEEPRVLADLRGIDTRHLCYRVAQVIRQKLLALLHWSIGEPFDQLGLPGRRRRRRHIRTPHAPAPPGTPRLPACWYSGRKRAQSIRATTPCAAPSAEEAATTSARPASASAGDKVLTPRLSSRARDSASAMPADQGPKLTLIPEMPCSRRRQASPSRKALAAP